MMINATTDPGLSNPDHMMKHTYVYKEERLSSMICFGSDSVCQGLTLLWIRIISHSVEIYTEYLLI